MHHCYNRLWPARCGCGRLELRQLRGAPVPPGLATTCRAFIGRIITVKSIISSDALKVVMYGSQDPIRRICARHSIDRNSP